MEDKNRLIVNVFFAWYDFWIGVYYDRTKKILYMCLIPTICISFRLEEVYRCSECRKQMDKIAHDTGDGWLLQRECVNEKCIMHCIDDCNFVDYPFGEEPASSKDLEDIGFKIV